jgi:murein DD-endopeptidase MepM/ murein hydrolase activator NlpD
LQPSDVSSADGGAAAPSQLRGARPATGTRYNTFIDWLDSRVEKQNESHSGTCIPRGGCHHRASGHVVQYGLSVSPAVTFVGKTTPVTVHLTNPHGVRRLSAFGDMVKRGGKMGVAGSTGLAEGVHVHFGMQIDGVQINPREWWDGHWIHDRILSKLEPGK